MLVNCTLSIAIATPILVKKIATGSGMVGTQTDRQTKLIIKGESRSGFGLRDNLYVLFSLVLWLSTTIDKTCHLEQGRLILSAYVN